MELLPAPALLRVRERPVAHRATGTARVFGAVSPIEPLDQGDDTSRCASSLTGSDAQPAHSAGRNSQNSGHWKRRHQRKGVAQVSTN